jgi:hypothetical protein
MTLAVAPDMGRLRRRWHALIEAALPWYDTEAARKERVHSAVLLREADAATAKLNRLSGIRDDYTEMDRRLFRR